MLNVGQIQIFGMKDAIFYFNSNYFDSMIYFVRLHRKADKIKLYICMCTLISHEHIVWTRNRRHWPKSKGCIWQNAMMRVENNFKFQDHIHLPHIFFHLNHTADAAFKLSVFPIHQLFRRYTYLVRSVVGICTVAKSNSCRKYFKTILNNRSIQPL